MSQREVEHLIGRLITDEEFRAQFAADPRTALEALRERGIALTPAEFDALLTTSTDVWQQAATALDPRLQKVSLRAGRPAQTSSDYDESER